MAVNAPSTTLALARIVKIGRGWIEAGLRGSLLGANNSVLRCRRVRLGAPTRNALD